MDWSPPTRTITIPQAEFDRIKHLPLRLTGDAVGIGAHLLSMRDTIACGDLVPVPIEAVVRVALRYHRLTQLGRTPQIGALLFDAAGDPRFLTQYFPLAASMPEAGRADFFALVTQIAGHPHLQIRLIGEDRRDYSAELAPSARWIAGGYMAEALWGRRDLLRRLLARPRVINLYTSEIALEQYGGKGSGPSARGGSIDLPLAALYIGFYTEMPGVAPFLASLGRMLDQCDGRSGESVAASGVPLGMNRQDGPLRNARARELFLSGKRLEKVRYERFRTGSARLGDPMPVGEPRLFAKDSEFLAGYLELFFRTPHYLAAQNETLFSAFALWLHQDPRRHWRRDCAFYVDQSRATYTAPLNLPPCGLWVPPAWWPFA